MTGRRLAPVRTRPAHRAGLRTVTAGLVVLASLAVLLASTSTPAQAVDVGVVGPKYHPVSAPTAEKPQSKLWHYDGRWWGVLYAPSAGDWTIHRFDWTSMTWTNTGTLVDNRDNTHADARSDGNQLYIASGVRPGSSASSPEVRLLRYSYDSVAKRYVVDAGFPVAIAGGPVEAIVIDKDTTRTVWATYTAPNSSGGRSVYVTHTTSSDLTWTAPYVLPFPGASTLTSDDISAVVAFRSKIGVMWSNQNDGTMYFAAHGDGDPDNVWSLERAVQGPGYADDHMNLKSLQATSAGDVYAVTKTELKTASAPLILVLTLSQGTWSRATFGRVSDNHTRPLLLIDESNKQLYVFAAAPCCSGGTIYMKQSPLDRISFPEGSGTPFISSASHPTLNNPTSTKQTVNGATGLLVLAGDDTTKTYLHNTMTLGAPPETVIDSGPASRSASTSATFTFSSSTVGARFECSIDGAPYSTCTSPVTYAELTDGPHAFKVRAVTGAADPTPASWEWVVDTLPPSVVAVAPPDGETAVSRTTTVEATFSEPIDPASIGPTTFTLAPAEGLSPLSAVVSYDSDARRAILRPTEPLDDGINYVASLRGGADGIRDTAGIPLTASQTWTFTTAVGDTNAPDTILADSGPTGTVDRSSATLSFSSTEPASTFECRLDGAPFAPCTSPVTFERLSDGPHTVDVRAVDEAGNRDPTPASRTWTVMATLFIDGFETGNLSSWTVKTGPQGSAATQTSIVWDGGHAARLSATTAPNSYSYAFRSLPAARTDVEVQSQVRIVSQGARDIEVLNLKGPDGTLAAVEREAVTGNIVVRVGTARFVTGASLPLSEWHHVALRAVTAGNGRSKVSLYLDGRQLYGTSSASLGTAGMTRVQIGNESKREASEAIFDNVSARA